MQRGSVVQIQLMIEKERDTENQTNNSTEVTKENTGSE